ncbi:hypothetical protein AJOOGB_AJOOGB_09770, partial [Dysosmobacter welbionis]
PERRDCLPQHCETPPGGTGPPAADQIEKGVFHEHRPHVPRQQEGADGAVLHRLRRHPVPPQHLRHQHHWPHGGRRHGPECPLLPVL